MKNSIGLTGFARRHWDRNFKGTFVKIQVDDFVNEVNVAAIRHGLIPGDESFVKHVVFPVSPEVTTSGVVELTPEIADKVRHGYEKRREHELAYLSRWVEGVDVPEAKFVHVVLYHRDQLAIEGEAIQEEWGIVSIAGSIAPGIQPRTPETIVRNALGTEFGGNGKPIDRAEYNASVIFWSKYILAKG